MAKRHLEQYDKNGNRLDIYLNDDEVLVDGQTLADKLSDMEDEIGEGGGGSGTVTGVKMNNGQPIPPDENGFVDLGTVVTDVSNKVDKETGKGLSTNDYTTTDKTKLAGIEPGAEVNVINGINKSDNTPLQPDSNGIVTLPPAASPISPATAAPLEDGTAAVGSSDKYAREDHVHPHDTTKLSKSDVSVETQGDGTVDINVKDNTYTINLNHTHENMAKLVKCTEATLPQTMADDTIYVQVDNLTTPSEIEALHIFGLEFTGGGLPAGTPQITKPKNTIPFNLGTAYGQGGATGTVQVKGKNLTANSSLTVSVSNGFSLSYGQQSGSSITISAADATIGADVDIFATAYGTTGTLLITSQTDNINHAVDLTSDVYEELAGVKLTGTQWLQTDYKPNANTKITMRLTFSENTHSIADDQSNKNFYFLACPSTSSTKRFVFYAYKSIVGGKTWYQIMAICPQTPTANLNNVTGVTGFLTADSTFEAGLGSFSFTAHGGSVQTASTTGQTQTMNDALEIGHYYRDSDSLDTIFNFFDLTIHELTISESNVTQRHYVPKKVNGVPGLYDTVNDTFISSKTSTELVEIPLT